MAKGNLFLGTAAKSVGDVVMYRREGSQVSRVRVRKIANPKTDAQCKQRAIMAPIPKFFSPLAIVLERSFEGLSKSKSYSKFLKVNADKARANDWLLPKGLGFFPLPYTLSQGSLPTIDYDFAVGSGFLEVPIGSVAEGADTIGALSNALVNMGYQNGDVVTILLSSYQSAGGSSVILDGHIPSYAQFQIDTTSDAALSTISNHMEFTISGTSEAKLVVRSLYGAVGAAAVIVARWENEKWRRSTQSLLVSDRFTTGIATDEFKAAAIASYGNTAGEPNPLVYLDGDELQ